MSCNFSVLYNHNYCIEQIHMKLNTFCVSNESGAAGSFPSGVSSFAGGVEAGMGMAAVADLCAGRGEDDELFPPPPPPLLLPPPRTMLPRETPRERRPAAPPKRLNLTLSAAAARGLKGVFRRR